MSRIRFQNTDTRCHCEKYQKLTFVQMADRRNRDIEITRVVKPLPEGQGEIGISIGSARGLTLTRSTVCPILLQALAGILFEISRFSFEPLVHTSDLNLSTAAVCGPDVRSNNLH